MWEQAVFQELLFPEIFYQILSFYIDARINLGSTYFFRVSFKPVILNRRVATQLQVVKEFQRVVELLSKKYKLSQFCPNWRKFGQKTKIYKNMCLKNILRSFLLEGGS